MEFREGLRWWEWDRPAFAGGGNAPDYIANFSVEIILQSRSTPSTDAVHRHIAAAMPAK